ncbi:(-)-germacrene D synthase [Salvia divinorum]|uniref:(-)-germacrene D synthase n=1 Tax=Salvia divinorum TaxID=28513 RepID=A0ABD1I4F2_SALDI
MAAVNLNSFYHRPEANFSPSLWGDRFISYISDSKVTEKYSKTVEVLKNDVRSLLTAPETKMIETMNLIDTIERLGVAYHFQNEIEEKLQHYFHLNTNYHDDEAYDLYTVALHFRLFRQHGHPISSEIFGKWLDVEGKFQDDLQSDAKGLLSLYEASYLRTRGETILDDALAFTTATLKSMAPNLGSPLKEQVVHALVQPLHLGIPRVEARSFISVYEEKEQKNETLMKLAKIDYNLLQIIHKEELSEISRWDDGEITRLPEYMRPLYKAVLELYEQFEEELAGEGLSYAVYYATEALKELVRGYLVEAKWFIKGYLPLFDEYLNNGLITSTYHYLTTTSFLGMGSARKDDFEWLSKKPKMLVAALKICRLVDDAVSYEVEKERGQVTTGIDSYMRENGVTKEEAKAKFWEMSMDAWKDINEEYLKESCYIAKDILMKIFNLERVLDVVYKNNEDGYTHPQKVFEPLIIALLVDPINV